MPVLSVNFSAQAIFCASCVVPPQLVKTRSAAVAGIAVAIVAAVAAKTNILFMFPCSVFRFCLVVLRRDGTCRRKSRRLHDLIFSDFYQVAYLGKKIPPGRIVHECGSPTLALIEARISPDMDDLVDRPDFEKK